VVIGLEFYMFSADKASSPGFDDLPFAQRPSSRLALWRFAGQRFFTADYTSESALMVWKLLTDRLASWFAGDVYAAGEQAASHRSPAQFVKMMLDVDKIMVAGLYPEIRPFRFVDDRGWSSIDALRQIVALSRAHHIDLRLYLSPH